MKHFLEILFPAKADNTLPGSKWPLYVFILIAVIGTIRSFIHILAPDGGAGSIAGMNLAVSGANEVIFAFALWGGEQLIYVLIQWVVIFRYRSLIPLMWGVQFFETLLRMVIPRLKPVTFAHTPPGAYQNYVYLVLSLVMVAWVVWGSTRPANRAE
ncbi:MAG TPA: hypothetical protein VMC62_09165 [Longilinea sp.]|nr:hypothetical protein [Longilinea sp.]